MAKAYDLTDRLLDGLLAEHLACWREDGLSYQSIAEKLTAETGTAHSRETVRRWCREMDETVGAR